MRNTAVRAMMAFVGLLVAAAAADVHVAMDRHACVGELTSQTGVEVGLFGEMANTGTSTLNVQCALVTSQPEAWLPPGVCIGVSCFPSDMDFSVELPPGAQLEVHLSFYPFDTAGKGVYWFRYANAARADSVRLEIFSGVESLLVDDDGEGDSQRFVERSIPGNRVFLTWDQSLEPLALSDVALLERIVWITGSASAGCITEDEAEVMTALLQDGGKLLLSGQNALEGEVGAAFGQDELGASVQSTSVESRHVRGVAGTVFDLISFDIAGGDGADNQTSPDALSPEGLAVRALRYESGEIAAVGRIGQDGRRSLACGFGIEACADSTVLEESLDFFLSWLDGDVSGDVAQPAAPLMVSLGPNPSRGILAVSLGIPAGSPVRILLADLSGRAVCGLFDGPWPAPLLTLPDVSQGTYVVRVHTPSACSAHPLIILEGTK
ncbi:hypothetical protein JXA88_00670 [Candidatus Fermentibacteria bacterium]|nr:hypothetical protein [Candidatus Fermentibacteria bacterium]